MNDGAGPPDPASVARMRERWREFARDDAMHYVAANRADWDTDAFYAMGRDLAAEIVAWAGDDLARERALEIGCGAGRMLVALAPYFERVDGIDFAPEMLDRAREHAPANVHLSLATGDTLADFGDGSLDLVVSIQVFQHIPDRSVIASYMEECGRVLRPEGRAVLQFDSRPDRLARRLALALPDALLPRIPVLRLARVFSLPEPWHLRPSASGERCAALVKSALTAPAPAGAASNP